MFSAAAGYLAARPGIAALAGLLSLVPFACANLIVANRLEPWFSLIRPGPHTSLREMIMIPVLLLLLLPLGAMAALHPVLRERRAGRRRWHPLNLAAAALLLAVFVLLATALGTEIYACEFQQIPNCD